MPNSKISKTRIIALVIGVVCLALILSLWRMRKARNDTVTTQCWEIGRDLVALTNSARLSSIQPMLQRQLAQLLRAPARVEGVRLGDEARPAGDMKATARVYLVNDRNERLGIRVQQEFRSDMFRVVGFWVPEGAVGAAEGGNNKGTK